MERKRGYFENYQETEIKYPEHLVTMITKITHVKECLDCAGTNLRYDMEKQQVICRDCGLIYEPLAPRIEKKFEKAHGI